LKKEGSTFRKDATLVVSQWRNPCDWVESMRLKNHHAPMHFRMKRWHDYVTTPWTMPRLPHDLELVSKNKDATVDNMDIPCQEHFTYKELNSCLLKPMIDPPFKARPRDGMSGHEPFYELMRDGSGRGYSSVVDMRRDKILNFLSIAHWPWIGEYIHTKYEDLLRHGTAGLVDEISQLTSITPKCDPFPPASSKRAKPRPLPDDFVQWMNQHVDWEVERLIGYDQC
jgi:hypothetical protein